MPRPPDSPENYAVRKGKLYIATYNNGVVGDYQAVGNAPMVEFEPSIERLPHYSSKSGFKEKDKNPVIQTEYLLNFELDEMAAFNMEKFLMGTRSGKTISGLQSANAEFAIKFESDNPIGPNETWYFRRVTISPNGAMPLVSDEWATMSFACEGLSDEVGNPNSPYFDVELVTTTTTSTTTTTTTTA